MWCFVPRRGRRVQSKLLISNRLRAFLNNDNTLIKVWEHNRSFNYENDNDKIANTIMKIIIRQRFSEIVIAQIL